MTTENEMTKILILELEKRIDQRFISMQRERDILVSSNKEALSKAEESVNGRLAIMNNLREDLSEWRANTMSRTEVEARFGAISEKIDALTNSDRVRTGRTSGFESTRVMVFAIFAAIGTFTSIGLGLYAILGH